MAEITRIISLYGVQLFSYVSTQRDRFSCPASYIISSRTPRTTLSGNGRTLPIPSMVLWKATLNWTRSPCWVTGRSKPWPETHMTWYVWRIICIFYKYNVVWIVESKYLIIICDTSRAKNRLPVTEDTVATDKMRIHAIGSESFTVHCYIIETFSENERNVEIKLSDQTGWICRLIWSYISPHVFRPFSHEASQTSPLSNNDTC